VGREACVLRGARARLDKVGACARTAKEVRVWSGEGVWDTHGVDRVRVLVGGWAGMWWWW